MVSTTHQFSHYSTDAWSPDFSRALWRLDLVDVCLGHHSLHHYFLKLSICCRQMLNFLRVMMVHAFYDENCGQVQYLQAQGQLYRLLAFSQFLNWPDTLDWYTCALPLACWWCILDINEFLLLTASLRPSSRCHLPSCRQRLSVLSQIFEGFRE